MLKIKFLGVEFENPTVLASGIYPTAVNALLQAVNNGAGGVTTKSIWLTEHKGHPAPTLITNANFTINAVGLSDHGVDVSGKEIVMYKEKIAADSKKAPILVSIVAGTKADFGLIAEKISAYNPDIIEVNISCPNVESEFGKPFSCDKMDAAEVTKNVKARTKLPVIIKLSPNVLSISEIAKSVADAGADGFCAINTLGPGMIIDLEKRTPFLSNKVGGVSGPGIKPIAVRCVYDIYKATKLPILGMGGIISGKDAIEIMMAGAGLIGLGAAIYMRGPTAFKLVADEIAEWMTAHGIKDLNEIIGVAQV
ncbi:MAG: dihydroorotate dehydrogenase, dihydroorotate dehydrogenase (fumarate) [Candidatus Peregrinibacteria bacterium GW2011_GWC2_39_14]|nr:MAG: Dihydroorotate dehydrogenase [Candidatus Peregrinibacteria bacterium GW2011_GWA2_38_36]KKR06821.1 MAG: dihydroorotate dehydrogenase, dihydroorotate dehydrogenase (fumarate) [Candidatus Peregrinibacteria bacterium GW2011_GWC2_39_14]